jgi:hypothetical protein
MNGSEWLSTLPENPGAERDKKVLDAISSGIAICSWSPITSSIPNHQATFQVNEDAVYVILDDGSRFRFQVSAKLAQQCADLVGGSLITSKISDLAYQQACIKLPATLLPAGADMVTTTKSKVWNYKLEAARDGREGLIRDCGKAWILHNLLGGTRAINYGYYDPHAPNINPQQIRMWQTVGTRHDSAHTDESQTLILMENVCVVDGKGMNVADLIKDPVLCGLASYDGVLKFTRQP